MSTPLSMSMQVTVKGLAGPVEASRYPLYFRLSSFVTVSRCYTVAV